MKTDLCYSKQGLFTAFFPVSKAGEDAWREIARQTEGTGKIYTAQLQGVLSSLRSNGYAVKAAPKLSEKQAAAEIDAILDKIEKIKRSEII